MSAIFNKKVWYLEGSLMPQAKFLSEIYQLALASYNFASKYAKGKVVLDAGCGSGYGSEKLLAAGAEKVYGIDISPNSITHCKKKYQNKNLIFKIEDLSKLSFNDRSIDLVVAFEVIEHVQDYEKALNEIHRVLKHGGILLISTPNKKIYSPDTKKPFYPFHYYEFYLADFKKILKQFKIKKIIGRYRSGKRYLYPRWHPKRVIRVIFANLPFIVKRTIIRIYLKSRFFAAQLGLWKPEKVSQKDIKITNNLNKARVFLAVCQKSLEKTGKGEE